MHMSKVFRSFGIALSLLFVGLCLLSGAIILRADFDIPNALIAGMWVDGIAVVGSFIAAFVFSLNVDKNNEPK